MTNFGASFKKARESRGISLDQIAKATRISTRFLAAIEDEEFQVLPGGIFNRGFVRTFAEHIGLDPVQAVTDYERLVNLRESDDAAASATPAPAKGERHLYPIAVGILAIAVAIFYLVTHETNRAVEIPQTPPPTTSPAPAPPPPAEPIPEAALPAAEPELTAPPSVQTLTLAVEAREKTWIKVTSDGNAVNPGEILEPGMRRTFTAENSLNISIGNAAGLRLKINDMALKPLGKRGEVRSVTITPANLKDFIG